MKKYKIQIRPLPPSISTAKYLYKKKIEVYLKIQIIFLKRGLSSCGPSQEISDIKK